MSNRANVPRKTKKKKIIYPDDRTPAIKKIDLAARILAVLLGCLVLLNTHSLLQGGGYEDSRIVPFFGFAMSRMEDSSVKSEIPDRSLVFIRTAADFQDGEFVQYRDEKSRRHPVGKIRNIDGIHYTLEREDQKENVTADRERIDGKVIGHTQVLYDFFGWYRTALGAVTTAFISILLLSLGDILMFKKRRAALLLKKEEQKKRNEKKKRAEEHRLQQIEERRLQKEAFTEIEDKTEERKEKRRAKLERERQEIAEEMKEMREQMRKEEEEFKRAQKTHKGRK